MKNVFWFSYINSIGGVETFFYYMVKKYQDHDITIYYKTGDPNQIIRLMKYARVIRWNGERITCDKFICSYNNDIIDYVDAKEYIQVIHADYKALNLKPNLHHKITKYVCVSEQAGKSFKELTGIEPVICYNPILIDKPQKMLNLISATRLTAEKGKDRIIRMGHLLDEKGIPYTWTIFTNDSYSINNTNIVYRKPKLDIMNYIANSDYLVQLSDGEAYCYSVVEALLVGTPVIVTDCPVFKELGVKDGKNGYILPHDFTDIPDITKIPKKFSFTPPKDIWDELLAPGAREYIPEEVKLIGVVCIRKYFDLQLNKMMMPKDKFIVNEFRAKELIDSKFVRLSD